MIMIIIIIIIIRLNLWPLNEGITITQLELILTHSSRKKKGILLWSLFFSATRFKVMDWNVSFWVNANFIKNHNYQMYFKRSLSLNFWTDNPIYVQLINVKLMPTMKENCTRIEPVFLLIHCN